MGPGVVLQQLVVCCTRLADLKLKKCPGATEITFDNGEYYDGGSANDDGENYVNVEEYNDDYDEDDHYDDGNNYVDKEDYGDGWLHWNVEDHVLDVHPLGQS